MYEVDIRRTVLNANRAPSGGHERVAARAGGVALLADSEARTRGKAGVEGAVLLVVRAVRGIARALADRVPVDQSRVLVLARRKTVQVGSVEEAPTRALGVAELRGVAVARVDVEGVRPRAARDALQLRPVGVESVRARGSAVDPVSIQEDLGFVPASRHAKIAQVEFVRGIAGGHTGVRRAISLEVLASA